MAKPNYSFEKRQREIAKKAANPPAPDAGSDKPASGE